MKLLIIFLISQYLLFANEGFKKLKTEPVSQFDFGIYKLEKDMKEWQFTPYEKYQLTMENMIDISSKNDELKIRVIITPKNKNNSNAMCEKALKTYSSFLVAAFPLVNYFYMSEEYNSNTAIKLNKNTYLEINIRLFNNGSNEWVSTCGKYLAK